MADYSSTPLSKKLGIKPYSIVALIGEPEGFREALNPLPDGVEILEIGSTEIDLILFFVREESEFGARLVDLQALLPDTGALWVAWPKKSAKTTTDLTFEIVQRRGLSTGWVDNKICSIDETFTALRFVKRVKDRLKTESK